MVDLYKEYARKIESEPFSLTERESNCCEKEQEKSVNKVNITFSCLLLWSRPMRDEFVIIPCLLSATQQDIS